MGCWKMRLQAVLGEVVVLRTFGRWVEGKVYGADESVRPEVSENGQVSDIGHFLKSARGTLPVCCVFGTAVVTGCPGRNVSAEWRVIMKVHGNGR